jgi:hypothetical protein
VADEKPSEGARRVLDSGTRARKWLIGIVVAAVAAVITSYVTGGITAGVDRVRGSFEEEPAPLGVTVTHSAKRGSAHWILPGPLASVRSLPLPEGDLGDLDVWDAWAREHGGLDAFNTTAEVYIEGATPNPVLLTGLTVDVVERAPPPRAVHVIPFGGGPVAVRHFQVDLDKSPPEVKSLPAEFDPIPAIDFPYKVSQSDPEVLYIVAYAPECDCTWRANLEWVYQGKKGTTVIDDAGQPFRTVSPSRSFEYLPKFDPG